MDTIDVESYILEHSSPEPELLYKLFRETNLKVLYSRMMSGHIQGSVLKMMSCMLRPERILEIGTFTGYSALCLAEGLTDNGRIDTIEVNAELEDFIRKYFNQSPNGNKLNLIIGAALEVLPTLNDTYDLVFIDADKENYSKYYDIVFNKVRIGGFILADNVLWDGKVLLNPPPTDKETQGIILFNQKIMSDIRVEKVILPLRDGVSIIRKISN